MSGARRPRMDSEGCSPDQRLSTALHRGFVSCTLLLNLSLVFCDIPQVLKWMFQWLIWLFVSTEPLLSVAQHIQEMSGSTLQPLTPIVKRDTRCLGCRIWCSCCRFCHLSCHIQSRAPGMYRFVKCFHFTETTSWCSHSHWTHHITCSPTA